MLQNDELQMHPPLLFKKGSLSCNAEQLLND